MLLPYASKYLLVTLIYLETKTFHKKLNEVKIFSGLIKRKMY